MILQILLVVLWSRSSDSDLPTGLPSSTLAFIDSVTILCLSWIEDIRCVRPSSLLNVYLLLSVLLDAVQARTLYLIGQRTIAVVLTTSICSRTVLLLVEGRAKTSYLRPQYKHYPPEARSGIWSLSFVWWINQLFVKGYRSLIDTNDLFSVDPALRSRLVGQRLRVCWHQRSMIQYLVSTGCFANKRQNT
jgi:hypothetical protein